MTCYDAVKDTLTPQGHTLCRLQDEWRGPQSLVDRALLLFGDPLQAVEVPWTPTSLIQDWRL